MTDNIIHVNYGKLEGIHVKRDTSHDDIAYCSHCIGLFGNRIKLKLVRGFLHCYECTRKTEIIVSGDFITKLKVKNAEDAKNVIIVKHGSDELNEFRQLKARYSTI